MRVITGTARGTKLKTPEGMLTRPTTDRVKEALFNIIQFDIAGDVLDLFAGTGQLGIEALSRGAAGCVFVDKNPEAALVIRRNLKAAGFSAGTQVLSLEAASYLAHAKDVFDLVFLDPPYAAGLLEPSLALAAAHTAPGGVIVCESGAGQPLPDRAGNLSLARTYRYGRVHIRIYRWDGGAQQQTTEGNDTHEGSDLSGQL